MLLILGIFFVITMNVNLFTEAVKQDYDQVEAYLLDDTTPEQIQEIMTELKSQEGVVSVTSVSYTHLDVYKRQYIS